LAPYCRHTWSLVDQLSDIARSTYWNEVAPDWINTSDDENSEGVRRLLSVGRPCAAFSSIKFFPEKIAAGAVYSVLWDMVHGPEKEVARYRPEQYHLEQALNYLNGSPILSLEQKARLEFAYLEVLGRARHSGGSYGIPNLERYLEAHPEVFVQAVVWSHRREDGGEDPEELKMPEDRVEDMAAQNYRLLEAIRRIPGHNDLGELELERLSKWTATVRRSSAELSRTEAADLAIGKLLSCASEGKDGVWPCEIVRAVMEDSQSEAIMRGARVGVYNSRGAQWRGEGGNQERELALKYRQWGNALLSSHPFVASKLLIALADTYDREANAEDTEAEIRRRMR